MGILDNYKKKNNLNIREKETNNSNLFFNKTFKNRQEYTQVKIGEDEEYYDSWIYSNSSYKNIISKKTIIFPPDMKDYENVYSGQYIYPKNNNDIYIIDGFDDQYETKKKGMLLECKSNLLFVNEQGNQSFPCYINDKINGIFEQERVIPLPTNNIEVKVQQNTQTYKIPINYRFIFGTQVFRVVSKNDYINQNIGVITFRMEKDQKSDKDDFVNKIAYNGNTYKIETSIDSIENIIGYSNIIDVKVYENDIELSNPNVEYISNNENIVTIDDSGNFELLSNGNTQIEISFGNEIVIIPVTVDLAIVEDVEFKLNPYTSKITKFEDVKVIEIEKYVNGSKVIEPLNISYNVSGTDDDSTYEINVIGNDIEINNISARNSKVEIFVDDGVNNGSFEILLTVY